MRALIIALISGLLIVSCGSKKKIVTKKSKEEQIAEAVKEPSSKVKKEVATVNNSKPNSTTEYITKYKEVAISEMKTYGIPASITLAQGILESGSGRGRLAVEASNHFGIKCHDWKGEKIYHDDDRSQECFRKYGDANQSFRDHSEFLAKRKRYGNLFKLKKSDYKGWAKELRKAGYATDKRYPQKLIDLIERYQLYKYDSHEEKTVVVQEPEKHIVVDGDTLYSIAKAYKIDLVDIKRINKLTTNEISIGQVLLLTDNSDH